MLGLTCDPWGKDDDFHVYVHHSKIFAREEGVIYGFPIDPNEEFSYHGYISRIHSSDGFEVLHVRHCNCAYQTINQGLVVTN